MWKSMSTRKTTTTFGALLAAASAVAACGPSGTKGNDEVQVSAPLYLAFPKWPADSDGVVRIPVCFDQNVANATTHFADDVVRLRAELMKSWSAVAKIDFSGFGTCGANRNGMIVVHLVTHIDPVRGLTPAGATNPGPGYQGPNASTDIQIRVDIESPSTGAVPAAVVIHEFGHALGFAHEMDRPDFTGSCTDMVTIYGGNYLDTPIDLHSIMIGEDCPSTGFSGNDLDFWDIWGAQIAYGARYGAFAQLATAVNSLSSDHLTGTSVDRSFADPSAYRWTYSEGWIYTKQAPQTVPLVLYWNSSRGDFFTTATTAGFNDATAAGYSAVRVEGYVYPTQQPGTIPLNLFWNSARQDNFTTSNPDAEVAALAAGYVFVRTEGFIFGGFRDSAGNVVGALANTPYVPGWWLTNPATGDHVSLSAPIVSLDTISAVGHLLLHGYFPVRTDAAFLRFNVPGTTQAQIFNSQAGDYLVVANPQDQAAFLASGYATVADQPDVSGANTAPAFLFTKQYDFGPTANVVPYRLYVNASASDRYSTSFGGLLPAVGDTGGNLQGFGFSQDPAATAFYGGANEIYDGGTACTVGGIFMHCCPDGYAMIGANIGTNVFKCVQTALTGPKFLGANSSTGNTWNCNSVTGSVMVGFHADLNTVACQSSTVLTSTVNGSTSYVDRCTYDDTRMHVCPFVLGAATGLMAGYNETDNSLICLNPANQIPAILSGPGCNPVAHQSSSLAGLNDGPQLAVDGNTDGNFWDKSVTHSNCNLGDWWLVDLGAPHTITGVNIYNRTDCCSERLGNFNVFHELPFQSWTLDTTFSGNTLGVPTVRLDLGSVSGENLLIQKTDSNCLSLAEVQVMGF